VLVVVQGHDHPLLLSTELAAAQTQWVAGEAPAKQFRCTAKVRYRQPDQACEVLVQEAGTLAVRFDSPQRAVTPGQYVVFYRDGECLGGAVIESSAS
jgi:tRNA-specific 2-thiouridylase